MPLSRRQILILAAAPPLLAAAGVGAVGSSWWTQDPGPPYRYLSTDEAAVVRALCGAAWPATEILPRSGADLDLDLYLDTSMLALAAMQRDGIRMLLHLLDSLPLPSHGKHFTALDSAEQGRVLTSWLDSDLNVLRSAAQSIVVLTGMGYTSHPDAAGVFGSIYKCGYGR